MKILVVEDNKKLLQTIEKEIIKHFEVKCCEDGEEALYLIKQGIYDLVVLDLMLPSLNGLEVLKNIRKDYIDTYLKAIQNEAENHLSINELLKDYLVEDKKDAQIDLSLDNITSDTFINLFSI